MQASKGKGVDVDVSDLVKQVIIRKQQQHQDNEEHQLYEDQGPTTTTTTTTTTPPPLPLPLLLPSYTRLLHTTCALLQRKVLKQHEEKGQDQDEGSDVLDSSVFLGELFLVCDQLDKAWKENLDDATILYKTKVLKKVLNQCDKEGKAYPDELVELCQDLLARPNSNTSASDSNSSFAYRTYVYLQSIRGEEESTSTAGHVCLRSAHNLLEGNTGCACWEAAFTLFEFIINHKDTFVGRRVLELGAGCGLVGVALDKVEAARVYLSDSSEQALENLSHNLALNRVSEERHVPVTLDWCNHGNDFREKYGRMGGIDIVVGSDITYDEQVIPDLVMTIRTILSDKPHASAYISAMPRNPATLKTFIEKVKEKGMVAEALAQHTGDLKYKFPFRDEPRRAIKLYKLRLL